MFKDNLPGKSWWCVYLSRHPDIKLKNTEPLGTTRAMAASEKNIRSWFQDFRVILEKYDIKSAEQLINCNETGFPLQTKSGKVAMDVTTKYAWHLTSPTKQSITTLMTIGADGQVYPPCVLYPR